MNFHGFNILSKEKGLLFLDDDQWSPCPRAIMPQNKHFVSLFSDNASLVVVFLLIK